MKVNIEQANYTIGEIAELQKDKTRIERTGHLGNVVGSELLAALVGRNLYLHAVKASDPHSEPLYYYDEERVKRRVNNLSKKQARNLRSYMPAQLTHEASDKSLADFHMDKLREVLPDDIEVDIFTHYLYSARLSTNALHKYLLGKDLTSSEEKLPTPAERYIEDGKAVELGRDMELPYDHYYDNLSKDGKTRNSTGLMLPGVATMMALDILAHHELTGETTMIHLSGSDMAHYTRDEEVCQEVDNIVQRISKRLGMTAVEYNYVIQNRGNLERAYEETTGLKMPQSQHLTSREEMKEIENNLQKAYLLPCAEKYISQK